MTNKVFDCPKVVQEETVGDFVLSRNDIGEIRISTKYSDTTFVIKSGQIGEFMQKLGELQGDTTDRQVILVFELIGTEGVLDEPEGDYKVKHAEDMAEQLKQMMLSEGLKYPNYGWSIIKATANNPDKVPG